MKIGFLVSANYAIGNPGNGVLAQAKAQAAALRKLGCEVVELNPWDIVHPEDFDVIQFFQGGFNFFKIEAYKKKLTKGILVFAPIIDTNQPNVSYRVSAFLGRIFNKIYTVPGEFKAQSTSSDLIVCRSKHEKKRLLSGLGINENKLEIVLNGTEITRLSQIDINQLRKKYNLPEKYILHISSYTDLRKNIIRLVKAVSELGYPLIIAGNATQGTLLDKLNSMISKNKNIKLMGFVEKDHLEAMYSCCKVFCLPSIHEGTGLVALEAGIRGANVVITKNGGPPDYFGDFVEYVNPYDVKNIKSSIEVAWNKDASRDLIDHINRNLKWKDSAERLLAIYNKHISIKAHNEGWK